MGQFSVVPGAWKEGSLINWEVFCDVGRGGSWLRLRMRLYGGRLCTLIDPVGLHEGDNYFDEVFFRGRFEQLDAIHYYYMPIL